MKLGLVLTNDWELYGDGSGDYFELQHKPLEALLDTVERHGARLTVMAEVGQQWAHQIISKQETWAWEIVEAWESILKETVRRKSDVQLHLHPQWLNARYENNSWQVDVSQWAISSLGDGTREEALRKGKRYLDSLLSPIDPDYECIAFRAGDLRIQPSKAVVHNLLNSGIICDSSVTKGVYVPPYVDFRDACSNFRPWFARDDDIKYESDTKEGLLEVPICSCEAWVSLLLRELAPPLSSLLSFGLWLGKQDREWLTLNNREKLRRYPLRRRPFTVRNVKSMRWLLSVLLARSSVQLDYDKLAPNIFVKCLQKMYESKEMHQWRNKNVTVPVVAMGHVKGMYNCDNIGRILREINQVFGGMVVYLTLSDAVRYWSKILSKV